MGVGGVAAALWALSFFLRDFEWDREEAEEEEESEDDDVPDELKEFSGSSDLETDRDGDLLYFSRSFLGTILVSFMVAGIGNGKQPQQQKQKKN